MEHRARVLSSLRQLHRLIHRLPPDKQHMALQEARATTVSRKLEPSSQARLGHMKELAAKLAYLKVITPRMPGDAAKEAGVYVLRDGQLVESAGEAGTSRASTGVMSHEEAMGRNNQHFKRFYGADKPKKVFF